MKAESSKSPTEMDLSETNLSLQRLISHKKVSELGSLEAEKWSCKKLTSFALKMSVKKKEVNSTEYANILHFCVSEIIKRRNQANDPYKFGKPL